MNMCYFGIRDQKALNNFSLHGNQLKKILQTILQDIILKNIISGHVLSIYRHIYISMISPARIT